MLKRLFVYFLSCSLLLGGLAPSATVQSRTRNGIDVSEWQGKINWKKVARTGVRYAYIRACVGSHYVDSQFRRNHRNARRNKIKTGFYHYITARSVRQARRQARFFARTIEPYDYDLRPVMDFESFGRLSKREINRIMAQQDHRPDSGEPTPHGSMPTTAGFRAYATTVLTLTISEKGFC